MSHSIGRMVSITPIVFGPGGVLSHGFVPQDALTGGKPRFVILHFTSMTFSGGAQLKVNSSRQQSTGGCKIYRRVSSKSSYTPRRADVAAELQYAARRGYVG